MALCYVPLLYEVPSEVSRSFIRAFREGGHWYELSRTLAGHLYTDLLARTVNPPSHTRLLTISFFTSAEAQSRERQSANVQALIHRLHDCTSLCVCLCTFTFLPWPETDPLLPQKVGVHESTIVGREART